MTDQRSIDWTIRVQEDQLEVFASNIGEAQWEFLRKVQPTAGVNLWIVALRAETEVTQWQVLSLPGVVECYPVTVQRGLWPQPYLYADDELLDSGSSDASHSDEAVSDDAGLEDSWSDELSEHESDREFINDGPVEMLSSSPLRDSHSEYWTGSQ
mgnify:CR=1 FL=1